MAYRSVAIQPPELKRQYLIATASIGLFEAVWCKSFKTADMSESVPQESLFKVGAGQEQETVSAHLYLGRAEEFMNIFRHEAESHGFTVEGDPEAVRREYEAQAKKLAAMQLEDGGSGAAGQTAGAEAAGKGEGPGMGKEGTSKGQCQGEEGQGQGKEGQGAPLHQLEGSAAASGPGPGDA